MLPQLHPEVPVRFSRICSWMCMTGRALLMFVWLSVDHMKSIHSAAAIMAHAGGAAQALIPWLLSTKALRLMPVTSSSWLVSHPGMRTASQCCKLGILPVPVLSHSVCHTLRVQRGFVSVAWKAEGSLPLAKSLSTTQRAAAVCCDEQRG
jgi:hypothetical protein